MGNRRLVDNYVALIPFSNYIFVVAVTSIRGISEVILLSSNRLYKTLFTFTVTLVHEIKFSDLGLALDHTVNSV